MWPMWNTNDYLPLKFLSLLPPCPHCHSNNERMTLAPSTFQRKFWNSILKWSIRPPHPPTPSTRQLRCSVFLFSGGTWTPFKSLLTEITIIWLGTTLLLHTEAKHDIAKIHIKSCHIYSLYHWGGSLVSMHTLENIKLSHNLSPDGWYMASYSLNLFKETSFLLCLSLFGSLWTNRGYSCHRTFTLAIFPPAWKLLDIHRICLLTDFKVHLHLFSCWDFLGQSLLKLNSF